MNRHYIKHFTACLLLYLSFRVMFMSDDLLTAVILGLLAVSVLTSKSNNGKQ
tara:strand:+ start:81 stop:236 length:156 start_codon:yes stop_codon:yes gene_type:complete